MGDKRCNILVSYVCHDLNLQGLIKTEYKNTL